MRRPARKFSSEAQLYASALRALARRAHSVYQMRVLLESRATDAALVPAVLARLKHNGYLDDGRFAADFARSRLQVRRQGRFRIARELRSRGVPDRFIEAALENVLGASSEAELLRAQIQRRLQRVHGEWDSRKAASLYRSLLRAGFPADLIRSELRALSGATPVEPPTPESPDTL